MKRDAAHAVMAPHVLQRMAWVQQWWMARGFTYVALPWMAPEDCMAHTRPPQADDRDPSTCVGPLVASGEQSFLWLDAEGALPPAEHGYIGWTPCFRREQYDTWHHHYFLKAELFVPQSGPCLPAHPWDLTTLVQAAAQCLQALHAQEHPNAPCPPITRMPQGHGAIDLNLAGNEVGSYGIRPRLGEGTYAYGTALAEPRWTTTLEHWHAQRPAPR